MKGKQTLSRREFLVSAAAVAGATALAAGLPQTTLAATRRASAEPVKIRFMGWMLAETFAAEKMQEIIDIFQEENPGITVEPIGVQFYDMRQRTTTMIGAGDPPDVFQSYIIWTPAWAKMGALEPLDAYMPADWKADLLNIKNGQVDGKQFAVTHAPGVETLFYNKTVFEQAGLDAGKPPTTWDEFVAHVEKISELPDVVGLAQTTTKEPSSFYWWLPWLWGFGGDLWDEKMNVILNNEAGLAWAKWAQDWVSKEYMSSGIDGFTMRQVFGQNRAGFILDGPWLKGQLREISGKGEAYDAEWGQTLLPAGPGATQPWLATADHQLAIAAQSTHKEEAWKFIEFLMRPDIATKYYQDLGMLPSLKSAYDVPVFAEDPYILAFVKAAEYVRPFNFGPEWPIVSDFWMQAIQEVLNGRDAKEALDAAKVNIETVVPPMA
jgi:multiple sugar transport system substrate-binding protein